MIVSQSVCVSSLNGTTIHHISILLLMFARSFLSKQPDSIVSSYFPQRVLLLHA